MNEENTTTITAAAAVITRPVSISPSHTARLASCRPSPPTATRP
jgi:hypothetical protein